MKLQCRSCHCDVHIEVKRADEEMTPEALRLFLGSKLGRGLKDENMGEIFIIKPCYADPNTRSILGCIEVVPIGGDIAYLGRLKVSRAFRRQGVATYLLEEARLECQRLGIKSAFFVTLLNGPAKLVEKCGAYELTKKMMISAGVPGRLLKQFNGRNSYWAFFDIKDFQPKFQHKK